MDNKYKVMSQYGNIIFYSWHRATLPESAEDVMRYGHHLATFFPTTNEWYKTKISHPEKFKKVE